MQGDPRWITVHRPAACARCGAPIAQGREVYYYPNSRTLYCERAACGRRAELDFEAHRHDEDGY